MTQRGQGNNLIIKRRQREGELAYYSQNVTDMKHMNSRAEWEDKLRVDAKEVQIRNTMKVLQNQEDEDLHRRRCYLAELYNQELLHWKADIVSRMETPEQRKQAMIERAKALKERRETERMKLVHEKRMQQYREQCDNLRTLDSKRSTLLATEERAAQLHEKKLQLAREMEYEKQMALLWEKDREKKIARDNADKRAAVARNAEVKKILDLQVNLTNERLATEVEAKRAEDQALLRKWAIEGKTEAEKERKLKMDAIIRAAQVKQFNRQRESIHVETQLKERHYDLQLLQLALEREAASDEKDRALALQFKQEAIAYQDMLKRQMAIEAEDLSYLDDIRKQMEEEVWEKRDAVHRAEATAREELLAAVLASRETEMEKKRQAQVMQLEQDHAFMTKWKQEAETALEQEVAEQHQRVDQSKDHQRRLREQMGVRKAKFETEKQEEFLELKRMQLAETQHQALVQHMFEQPHSGMKNNRRKTAEWYFNC